MKAKKPPYEYGECHVCGEQMEERHIKQGFWLKNKLIIIEELPAGVCPQCGEKVVKADIGQRIAALAEDAKGLRRTQTINVPV